MIVIPAIDLIDGQCVRLTEGVYDTKKIYSNSPIETAQSFEIQGATHLHLVDLDGAKAGKVVNIDVLRQITKYTKLKVDFGGGIKSENDLQLVLDAGAEQVTLGSIAVSNRTLCLEWLNKYGANRFVLGADVRNEQIAINAWLDTTNLTVFDFLKDYLSQGFNKVICTDIQKDGRQAGASTPLYQKIIAQFPQIQLIASGGVGVIQDLQELKQAQLFGTIVGKAFYENTISWKEISEWKIEN